MFISLSDEWGDTRVRIFDEDDDGCIHAGDLVDVLTTFGDKISKSEAKKLVQTADKGEGGLIDYEGMWDCEWNLFCFISKSLRFEQHFAPTNAERERCWNSSGGRSCDERARKNAHKYERLRSWDKTVLVMKAFLFHPFEIRLNCI